MSFTIGGADKGEEYLLTQVVQILPVRDGTVWIVDFDRPTRATVRRYDKSGRFLQTLGAFGAGPGEYRWTNGIGQLPDGRLVLRDDDHARILVYTESGDHHATWALGGTYPFPTGGLDGLTVDANAILWLPFRLRSTRRDVRVPPTTVFLRVDGRTGRVIDTVAAPSLEVTGNGLARVEVQGGSTSIPVPNAPRAKSAIHPLGVFVTIVNTRYAIDFQATPPPKPGALPGATTPGAWAPGASVLRLRKDVAEIRLSDRERQKVQQDFERRARSLPGFLSFPNSPTVPAVVPPLGSGRLYVSADDGRIWVSVADRASLVRDGGRESTTLDVFEPTGEYVGRVRGLPDPLMAIRRNEVWTTRFDADGVPQVVMYRVTWR